MSADPPLFGEPEPGVTYWRRPGAYALIRNQRGQLAVVQVEGEGWFLPGGGVQPGESDRAALVREVREETGLEVNVGRFLWEAHEHTWAREERHFVKEGRYYEASLTGTVIEGSEEDHTLLWVDPAEAAARLHHVSQRALVTRWVTEYRPDREPQR